MRLKLPLCLMLMLLLSSAAEGIDIENCSIGTGSSPCYSFAIFADPQSDTGNLTNAVAWVNANAPTYNIKFVIVLGDLIQGEKASSTGYDAEFTAAETELSKLIVPWIPMIGNHDVWCNLAGETITLPDDTTIIPQYTGSPYPEKIFNDHFSPVYSSLANTLAGWKKQEGMPIANPNASYPNTYFQNFAFDYGDYHFVCLDFGARDDFNPEDWKMNTNRLGEVTVPKNQFGYARIENEYGSAGTIQWLKDHLENYSDPASGYDRGYKRSRNIILLSHQGPVFNLSGTGSYFAQLITWNLSDENSYGFSEAEYNDLVALLNQLNSSHNFSYQWFAGHYHAKNMSWNDTAINPDTLIKVIASTSPLPLAERLDKNPYVDLNPAITVNNNYSVTTQDNPNGSITIVEVRSPLGTDPDPSIYTQTDPQAPLPPVWDNPDIELYQNDIFVPSGNLDYGDVYEIQAKIYNKGCNDAKINVRFTWSNETLNYKDQENGFVGGTGTNQNVIASITVPPGKEVVVGNGITWDTSVVSSGAGLNVVHACVRAIIENISADSNPANNRGQENCDVRNCKTSELDKTIRFSFPITNITGITVDASPKKGRLWTSDITWSIVDSKGDVTLRLVPNASANRSVGYNETFSLTAKKGNLTTGGVDVKVVVNDPPILDWAGSSGYTTDGVEPDGGNAGTKFTFRVKYEDLNDHAPAPGYPRLYILKGGKQIQGSPFVMSAEESTDTIYSDGKIYTYPIELSEPGNDYAYRFWARDALLIGDEGPAISVTSGPKVLCEKMTEDEYKDLIIGPIDVDKIKLVYNAANKKWVKSSPIKKYAKILMYLDKNTGYLITLRVNSAGYAEYVDFSRHGDKTITEIPCELAVQSLAKLGFP